MHVNRRVGALFRMGEAWITRGLGGSGLTSTTAYMVLELAEAGTLSLTELGRRVGTDRAHVTRSIRQLEEKGLLVRKDDPRDGRSSLVSLTPAGRESAGTAEKIILTWVSLLVEGVDPADVRTTGRTIDRFFENALKVVSEEV